MPRCFSQVDLVLSATLCSFLALAFGSACGGADDARVHSEFEQRVTQVREALATSLEELRTAGSLEAASERIDDAVQEMSEAADGLDETKVPQGAEEERDRIVRGLRALAMELQAVSAMLDGRQLRALVMRVARLDFESLRQIARALEDLRRDGFEVGQLTER